MWLSVDSVRRALKIKVFLLKLRLQEVCLKKQLTNVLIAWTAIIAFRFFVGSCI